MVLHSVVEDVGDAEPPRVARVVERRGQKHHEDHRRVHIVVSPDREEQRRKEQQITEHQ